MTRTATLKAQASHPPAGSWWAEPLDWQAFTLRARQEWAARMRYRGGELAYSRPGLVSDAQLDLRDRRED